MDPMTQTVVRYVLTWVLTAIATKSGIAALATPDTINLVMAAVAAVAAAGVGIWGICRSTRQAKVNDLAASKDIVAIHASPDIVSASDSPKVVAAPPPGSIVDTHVGNG